MVSLNGQKVIKGIISLILSVFFAHTVIESVLKYRSQPTSTAISKSIGDTDYDFGIRFPQLTFCDFFFAQNNSVLKKCNQGEGEYLPSLLNCLKDENFSLEEFQNSINYKISDYINYTCVGYGVNYNEKSCQVLKVNDSK